MKTKTVEINIPEGKRPKMTESENKCVIDWVPEERIFEDYVKEFCEQINDDFGIDLDKTLFCYWKRMFKFGLLQFIADDLNEEQLDWGNTEQYKGELYFNTKSNCINYAGLSTEKFVTVPFTRKASKKAIKIIPAEFLKTL